MRRKIFISALIIINLFFLNCFLVLADDIVSKEIYQVDENYQDYIAKNVPEKIINHFNLLYKDVVSAYVESCCSDENINFNELEIGSPFIINNIGIDIEDEIWYYPIYSNHKIICLVCIFESDNTMHCTVTGELVERLNDIQYEADDIIVKDDNGIYAIDKSNHIHLLNNSSAKLCELNGDYDKLYLAIKEDSNLSANKKNILSTNIISEKTIRKSPIKNTRTGVECDMTNCFVQQYDKDICWAASVATIIRYKVPIYQTLNAFDVAYALGECYGIDTSTKWGKEQCLKGMKIDDIQVALALYGVYYTYSNSVLNFEEVKKEIQNSEPMIMGAISRDGEYVYGHSTVIYGYISSGDTNLLKIWNPGNAMAQLVVCIDGKEIQYIYHDYSYSWYSTIYNGTYRYK